MRRYQTSIKSLIKAKKDYQNINGGIEPIFLSDWDSDYSSVKIPHLMYNETDLSDLQKYYFWTDEENYRSYIQSFFSEHFSKSISTDCFTIGSNGTSSIMLALTALKEAGKRCALILTPIYFSTLNLLDELDFDVIEFKLTMKNNFDVDIEKLENTIVNAHVDTIIITNPLFGSGVEISISTIKLISGICNVYNVCLLMDYIYGGMAWNFDNPTKYIFNDPVYEAVSLSEQHIFIESISKRIFLNGAKFALVFSSPSLMRRILRLSVFMVGSMSLQQVRLIPQIYSSSSVESIINLILENATKANQRYRLIKTLLSDTHANISNANHGYFALISLPKKNFSDDNTCAIDILNKVGVLTVPHSRYLFEEEGLYSFRINLLLEEQRLIEGITKIGNLV